MVRTLLILSVIATVWAGAAQAGKNAGGALIVHTNDQLGYRGNPCPRFEDIDSPGSCEAAGTQTNKNEAIAALIWIIAAFPEVSDPGVTRVDFGLSHSLPVGEGYFPFFGFCGPANTTESADPGWPDDGGTSISYGAPVPHDRFFPVYFLMVYGNEFAYAGTGAHPGFNQARFQDDSVPAEVDACHRFGQVRWYEPGYNECPDGPPPIACCHPDGHCALVSTEEQCTAVGAYSKGSVSCEPNPCVAVPGACCFESGECVQATLTDCAAAGGLFLDFDLPCKPNPCPPPSACCLNDGSCRFLTESTCLDEDGEWHADVLCEDAGCPPGGACCFVDGPCDVFTETECGSRGGLFQGAGTACDPPICPPVFACCFENGSCSALIEMECTARGGLVLGLEPTCSPNPCIGACCFFNGSCQITTIATCQASNGEYLGSDYSCVPNPCATAAVPDATVQSRTWGRIKAGYR